MQDATHIKKAPPRRTTYWKSQEAFKMAEKLEREDPNVTFFIGTSNEFSSRSPAMFLMVYSDLMKRDVDLYEFETYRSRCFADKIIKRLNLEYHRYDGRNFNVVVQRAPLSDLLALLPTVATIRRTKLQLLIS